MKKYLNKKTYSFIALFFVLTFYFYSQKSYIVDNFFKIDQNITIVQTDIKIVEKKLAKVKADIEEIKRKNNEAMKEKVDINTTKDKIKKQLKAYNLINDAIKINLNTLNEQNKYIDAFKGEFEIIVSPNARALETAKALDFLGIYGVVESFENNKAVVFVSVKEPQKQEAVKTPVKKDVASLELTNKDSILIPQTKHSFVKSIQKIEHPQKEDPQELNNEFKKEFLSSLPNSYTINLFTSTSFLQTIKLLRKYDLLQTSFVFKFGEDTYKVMYGVYPSYEDAMAGIMRLPQEIKVFNPRAEKIIIKQKLYKKYHTLDKEIE